MKLISVKGLTPSQIREADPEDLLRCLNPLISKYALKYIPGYDFDDRYNEISMIILKCQKRYSPETKAGYEGRKADFLTYVINAINNGIIRLEQEGRKQISLSSGRQCALCGHRQPTVARMEKCIKCSGKSWRFTVDNFVQSLDAFLELHGSDTSSSVVRSGDRYVKAYERQFDEIEDADLLDRIRRSIPEEYKEEFTRALADEGRFSSKLKDYLTRQLTSNCGILVR